MLLVFLLLFTETSAGYYDGCDHTINVKYGETAEIESFNYPDSYSSEQNCRWKVDSPPNTQIFLKCPDLHQPKEDHCLHIAVDRTVEPNPIDVKLFCRADPFSVHSLRNSMTITINNNKHSLPGEAFKCFLTVDYEDCDRTVDLELDQKGIEIQSPSYPLTDPAGTSCRWKINSPPGTRIFLSCPNSDQQKEEPCGGWFTVAPDGDVKFTFISTTTYCRHQGFKHPSRNNRMIVAYNASPDSKPGNAFTCYLTVENVLNPEPGYRDKECSCGRRNTARIIGGENTGVNEFPMMAALVYLKDTDNFCGATIIAERWALTAAHCVQHQSVKKIGLLVSEHDRSKPDETETTHIILIDRVVLHPDFNTTANRDNDIALVYVDRPIAFNRNIGPACLPFSNRDQSLANKNIYSLGWGRIGIKRPKAKILQKAEMTIMEEDRCPGWLYTDFYKKAFCTVAKGKDFTFADSGGPTLWLDPVTFQWKVVGIHCGGSAHLNKSINQITRVSYYLDWVETNAEGAEFCRK